jgi:hypothetical protein
MHNGLAAVVMFSGPQTVFQFALAASLIVLDSKSLKMARMARLLYGKIVELGDHPSMHSA